jgi:serine/threonine protein kinase
VLFKKKPSSGDLTVKIVDFGIAGSSNPNKDGDKSNAGSLSYMPPEVLDNTCTQAKPSIDVWALGCILFAMLIGRLPMHGHTPEEQLEKIDKFSKLGVLNFSERIVNSEGVEIPPTPTSKEVRDLILRILEKD